MQNELKDGEDFKWQSRNRPEWPGNEPPWSDEYKSVNTDQPYLGVYLQCEYRKVPLNTPSYKGS